MQKIPGMQDYYPEKYERIQSIIEIIRKNALLLGAEEMDTPAIESKKLLLNKYGEEAENKLIYKIWEPELIKDKKIIPSQPNSALRYDLTVSFARYLMNNGIEKMKRLQIGKVYRRDKPCPESGRFREFIQADYDIVGDYSLMLPEAEIFALITRVMKDINFNNYIIKFNFRQNLEKIVGMAQIPSILFKSVSTSIDKLDKYSWEYVAEELEDKKISLESIEILKNLLEKNYFDSSLTPILKEFQEYLDIYGIRENIKFDASLARGLDYYTGLIYEVVLKDNNNKIGTLIAGGRYDKLIYKTKRGQKTYIPAIGVSFGVNRMEMVIENLDIPVKFKILIVSDKKYIKNKIFIQNLLNLEGYQAEYIDQSMKVCNQINYGIKNNFNYILICGEDEDLIKVKKNDQSQDRLTTIENLITTIKDSF